MKRLFSVGPRKTELKDVEMTKITDPGQVLIKVKYNGVCMSEHYNWETGVVGRSFGHEPVGTIVEVGSDVKDYKVGDRVSGMFNGSVEYARAKPEQIVHIPDNVKTIMNGAFWKCEKLTQINLPSHLDIIESFLFCDCKSLESIQIPPTVLKIGSLAFHGCSSLQSVVIPDGVTIIGEGAFEFCSELKNVVIPSSVKDIYDRAFSYCYALDNLTIPHGVTFLGKRIVAQTAIRRLEIPRGVCYIDKMAFDGNLKMEVIMPKDLPRPDVRGDIIFYYWLD